MPSKMSNIHKGGSLERKRMRAISYAYEVLTNCARINRQYSDVFMESRVLKAVPKNGGWVFMIEMPENDLKLKTMVVRGIQKMYPTAGIEFVTGLQK